MLTPGPGVLRPAELISTEMADLLAQMYAAAHGQLDDARSTPQRTADYLGCHEEVRASA